MPRYPVDSISLASGYGFRPVRGASQGHWGFDLAGRQGDSVVAPEAMTITRVWGDDSTPPFAGYGPGGVEGLGRSGVYHLLAHLDPITIPVEVGEDVQEGERVGSMPSHVGAAGPHTHWEVRRREIDDPATRQGNTYVPSWWLDAARAGWTVADGGGKVLNPGSGGWLWLLGLLIFARSLK
jgi:murein DD-endopeptidase MepM/ murein hydrolase activator NlpD